MSEYQAFLDSKRAATIQAGKLCSDADIHPMLFPFQRDTTRWAVAKGRCAVWLECGLGKTFIQLEWARLIGVRTLIIAPLSVARQTVREARKIGLDVRYVRSGGQVTGDHLLWITNYEMIDGFDFALFGAVVLDESSILKSLSGKTKQKLIEMCTGVPYRLCCSATPAPNDYTELGNHAHVLGICTTAEMLSMFFVNANKQHAIVVGDRIYEKKGSNKGGTEWRLKHHAEERYFEWLASWAITMTRPSDLGYDDDGFILPPLTVSPVFVKADYTPDDQLFFTGLKGITDRVSARRNGLEARLAALAQIVNAQAQCYNLGYEHTTTEDPHTQTGVSTLVPGSAQRRATSKRQDVLPGAQRAAEYSGERTGTEANARRESCTEGIQSRVALVSPRSCTGVSSRKEGQPQCAATGTLYTGRMETISCLPTSEGLAEEQSRQEKSPTTEEVWDNTGRLHGTDAEAGRLLCNLRVLGPEQPQLLPISGSLPLDGDSQGSTLHELQPCIGEDEGQSQLVQGSGGILGEQWVIWCGLDEEQRAIEDLLGSSCVSVYGSLPLDEKERLLGLWLSGGVRFLLSKPRICGLGLNLQVAHRMVFFGLSDSWEAYYQCVRREWRYRQPAPVNVYIILSDAEGAIYSNVMRKDALATRLRTKLVAAIRDYERSELGMTTPLVQEYREDEASGKGWRLLLGDSCKRLAEIETDSVSLSVYSPPFADLFTYSASDRDLGNSRGWEQFFDHYAFIIREVLRVTQPGRLTCVHTSDIPAMQSRDGWIGVKDFPGECIRAYEREGWTFVGRAFVQKNPQAQAIRVKSKALLFVQLRKDSSDSRPALVDQILLFKKDGDNTVPVNPVGNGELDNEGWIEWAHGIWLGISESDTLRYSDARAADDEKHICPLQLGTIERCIKLYSNPDELVLSPFAGIGSECYQAVRFGRRAIGIELKPSYWETAVKNLKDAEHLAHHQDMFSLMEDVAQ